MRIHANLIAARPRAALPLAVLLWALAVGGVAVAAALAVDALDMRADEPRLRARLVRLGEQIGAIELKEAIPPPAALQDMRQRVTALNSLSTIKGWSTSQVLAWLEGRMPDKVYLVSIQHKLRDGELLLVAESSSAEALTALLLQLEKEAQFAEVLLSKQGARTGPGAPVLQFEIRARQKS